MIRNYAIITLALLLIACYAYSSYAVAQMNEAHVLALVFRSVSNEGPR